MTIPKIIIQFLGCEHIRRGSQAIWTVVLTLVAAGLLLTCCSKTTKPKPVKYNIYLGCPNTDQMYVYDADSLTLIDSIPGLGNSYSMVVSPDGRYLYVEGGYSGRSNVLIKIDAKSKQVVGTIPSGGPTELAGIKAGQLLLRGNPTFYEEVIDPKSLSVVHLLADSLLWRDGPTLGTKIAAVAPGNDHRVRVLDIETGDVYGNYLPRLESGRAVSTYRVVLHPDGKRVLVLGASSSRSASFVIGDVTTGATLLEYPLAASEGRIAISDDGRYAIVTDPSSIGYPEMTPPTTDVFDLQTNSHLKRLTDADFSTWSCNSQIQFLPDSKRALVAPAPKIGGPCYLINLVTLREEKAIWPLPDVSQNGALGVGPRP